MSKNYQNVIRIKNDPVNNNLTAPGKRLIRPEINYQKIFIYLVVILILVILFSNISYYILNFLDLNILKNINKTYFWAVLYIFWAYLIISLYLKNILITMIRLYQRHASAEIRLKCCYQPSCSEYGVLAIDKFGVFKGTILTIKRLRRCEYPGGIDFP